jgi:hypothetical protein
MRDIMSKLRTRTPQPADRLGGTTADEPGLRKPARTPWKTALIAFGLMVLTGAVVAGIITAATPSHGRSAVERGKELGNAIAPIAIAVAVVAYVVADRRRRRRRDE